MRITVQPVDQMHFDDVQTVFGPPGQPARCQCQGFRMGWHALHTDDVAGRRELLRDQVIEGHGLVAHLDGEPVGWCSLAPRSDYTSLRQTVWKDRDENRDDAGIWAVTCFVTRAGFRHQGGEPCSGLRDDRPCARPGRAGRGGLPDETRPW